MDLEKIIQEKDISVGNSVKIALSEGAAVRKGHASWTIFGAEGSGQTPQIRLIGYVTRVGPHEESGASAQYLSVNMAKEPAKMSAGLPDIQVFSSAIEEIEVIDYT